MAMAPPTNMSFHLLFTVIFTTAVTIVAASAAGQSQVATAPSSAEALAFLHARCANTTYATVCYNTLLPFAGSFNGSQVKISTSATVVAFGQFKSFLKKVKRVQAAGGMGTGRCGDFALGECVADLEQALEKKTETLSWLRVLDGSGWSKDMREDALDNVKVYVSVQGAHGCIEDFTYAGDAALSSLVAKKVMAMARNCNRYQQIALDLVAGIKL